MKWKILHQNPDGSIQSIYNETGGVLRVGDWVCQNIWRMQIIKLDMFENNGEWLEAYHGVELGTLPDRAEYGQPQVKLSYTRFMSFNEAWKELLLPMAQPKQYTFWKPKGLKRWYFANKKVTDKSSHTVLQMLQREFNEKNPNLAFTHYIFGYRELNSKGKYVQIDHDHPDFWKRPI